MKRLWVLAILIAPLLCSSDPGQALEKIDVNPLVSTLAVSEGRCVGVAGGIEYSGGFSRYAGVIVVNFHDADGKEVYCGQELQGSQGSKLKISKWLKGYYTYLPGNVIAVPFYFDINIPKRAVTCKVRIGSKSDKKGEVLLTDFSVGEYSRSRVLRHQFTTFILIGVSLFVALILVRKAGLSETVHIEDGEGWRGALRIGLLCIASLCFIMATVFLWEAYVVGSTCKSCAPLSFSAVMGQFFFVVFLSAIVCHVAHGRRLLLISFIMLICLILNVIVIRLTHSLYDQIMFSDYNFVEMCIKSSLVECQHKPMFFYWCNYELLCSFLGKVFYRDIQVAQYLNALCATAVIYPVFRLSEKTARTGIATFISLLMGLSPILSIFGTILTGDFIAATAYTYAFYFFICVLEGKGLYAKIRDSAISGMFLGVGQLMKPIAIIFVVTMITMALISIFQHGRKSALMWLSILAMIIGTYVFVGKLGQDAIIEVAMPLRIDPESLGLDRSLLVGLNMEIPGKYGRYNRDLSMRIDKMTKGERQRALVDLIKTKWNRFPTLFSEKLDVMYSNSSFAYDPYATSVAPSSVPQWVKDSMCTWNFIVLILVGFGVAGLAVCRYSRRNDVGIASVLVVAAFTGVLLLVEVQGRYKIAIYPIYFLLIPYAIVWFKKENPLYVRIGSLSRKLWFYLEGKLSDKTGKR